MRRVIFIFLLIIVSLVIILATFSGFKDISKEDIKKELNNFLSVNNESYYYDESKQEFIKGKSDNSQYLYYAINPIDGIYYKKSENKNPIKIKIDNSGMKINVSTGQYIFALNDVFQKYKVDCNGFNVSQLGKGIFFLNNDVNDFKLYSFNTILDVGMIQKDKSITYFKLFPSLLFKHNFFYADFLKGADILRISMVDSISYVDLKNSETSNNLVGSKEGEINLIGITKADIFSRLEKYKKMYDYVLKIKFDDMPGYSLMLNYQSFFDNQNKKEIYLKGIIIKNFLDLINASKNQSENYANISTSLDELARISDEKKEEGISLLKSYYYLAYYSNILLSEDENKISNDSINAGRIIRQALNDTKVSEDYFSTLSDIYFNYNFSGKDQSILDGYLNNYLADIKKRKVLNEEDFLSFSFFLTQYLLSHNDTSQDYVNIIIYLIEMFDNYHSTIKDDSKKFSAIGVQFFNFEKIITNINNGILRKYFQNSKGGAILKPEYIRNNGVSIELINISDEFIESLDSLKRVGNTNLQNKKQFFDRNLNIFYNNTYYKKTSVIDNYSKLAINYSKLEKIVNSLKDYNKYFNSLKLNSETKGVLPLIFEETFNLSEEDLKSYLMNFNGIDVNSIKLKNILTMNLDKYYDLEVSISGNIFTFKLNPIGHIISNVMIRYPNGTTNSMFNTQAINLDEKQQFFEDKFVSEQDMAKKAKYNFENFFNIVFLSDFQNDGYIFYNGVDNNSGKSLVLGESKYISVFKQDSLLDGDFKLISKVLPIPFKNIIASINEKGEYQIKINSVRKSFSYMSESIIIDFDSDYDFVKKSFSNIRFRVYDNNKNDYNYEGNFIEVLPSEIMIQDFSNKIENLGQYLYTLRRIYSKGQGNFIFDLNLGKVFINSVGYDLLK